MNGFFQFENAEDGLYINIHVIPNSESTFSVDTVLHCLDYCKINVYDIGAIKAAISSTEDVRIRIGESVHSQNEWGEYFFSPDELKVEAVFYPGFVGSSKLSVDEIVSDLASLGVKYGIDAVVVKKFVEAPVYYKKLVVAFGEAPVEGKDAVITYNFDINKKAVPKVKEDGTVDFHDLDNLNHVKKGDVVATLEPEVLGKPGIDVKGKSISPKRVQRKVFKYGRNLVVSEDGKSLISQVNGHVTLEGDKVFVSNVYEVVNVDASTGDINYEGNVLVTGNLNAGFSINATGDVEIRGIVEGARISAGGNIIVGHGIQGMGKAVVECRGDLTAKFIESANRVTVGGNISTDSILHSNVEARGKIVVEGKNGLIIGGDIRSKVLVSAKFIGNEMGTATTVGAGVDPSEKRQLENLKKEIVAMNANKEKINQIITVLRKKQDIDGTLEPDKLEMLQKSMKNLMAINQDMITKRKELSDLSELVDEDVAARISVSRTVYPGTRIVFGDNYMFLKKKCDFCQFVKQGADIKNVPM